MIKKSQYMIKIINHYMYGGDRPTDCSPARWAAMVKFIQKNFAELTE